MRGAVLAAALCIAAAGCGGSSDALDDVLAHNDPVTVTVETVEPPPQVCANPDSGYVVQFPGSWHTNADGEVAGCRFFHPSRFEVPARPETLAVAVSLRRERVPFALVTAYGDDAQVEELDVDGHRARRAEYVASGETFLPAGTRVYELAIDLGDETLIATARDVGDGLAFDEAKDVLDRMTETLQLAS